MVSPIVLVIRLEFRENRKHKLGIYVTMIHIVIINYFLTNIFITDQSMLFITKYIS